MLSLQCNLEADPLGWGLCSILICQLEVAVRGVGVERMEGREGVTMESVHMWKCPKETVDGVSRRWSNALLHMDLICLFLHWAFQRGCEVHNSAFEKRPYQHWVEAWKSCLQPSASQYHSGCNSCKWGRPQHLITGSFSQKCSNFPDTVTACCIMLDITAGVWHVSDWYCKWIHCSLLPSPVFANKRTMVNTGHKCPLRLTDMSLVSPGYSQAFCSGLGDCAVCWAVMQHWDFL